MTGKFTKADGAVFQVRPRRLDGASQASYSIVLRDGRLEPEDSCWTSETIRFGRDKVDDNWLTSEAAVAGFSRDDIEWSRGRWASIDRHCVRCCREQWPGN